MKIPAEFRTVTVLYVILNLLVFMIVLQTQPTAERLGLTLAYALTALISVLWLQRPSLGKLAVFVGVAGCAMLALFILRSRYILVVTLGVGLSLMPILAMASTSNRR